MIIPHLLKQRFTPILFTLLLTLQIAACGSDDGTTDAGNNPANSNVKLSWVAPSEREDGSNLNALEIEKYIIYYRESQTQGTDSITVTGCYAVCSAAINLPAGSYQLSVTTVDTDGRESLRSEEIMISVS